MSSFPGVAIGFWFAAVVLLVAGAAAGAGRRYVLAGVLGFLGLISVLLGLHVLPYAGAGTEAATFWICTLVALPAAVTMITTPKAVHSALCLALVMISLAVLYAVLDAPFLAFVQIIVYTGAVLMLFLFVLMLIGVDSSDALVETIRGQRAATAVLGLGFLLLLLAGVGAGLAGSRAGSLQQANGQGNVFGIGQLVFTTYVFAFEVTSALLITAALGAMVLAYRQRDKVSQKNQQRDRIAGPHPSPMSPPGVYARRNSVDTPALGPGGVPLDQTVPVPLQAPRPETDRCAVRGGTTTLEAPPEIERHVEGRGTGAASATVATETAAAAGDPLAVTGGGSAPSPAEETRVQQQEAAARGTTGAVDAERAQQEKAQQEKAQQEKAQQVQAGKDEQE